MTASSATEVMEAGGSALARDLAVSSGCRGLSGPPIAGSIGAARNRPGVPDVDPARGRRLRPPFPARHLLACTADLSRNLT